MFDTVTMYALNYGTEPVNQLVEIARWTAPLATATGIILMIQPVLRALHAKLLSLRKESIAVYGDPALFHRLQAKYPVIQGDQELLSAHTYLLFGEEQENLDFYQEHLAALCNHEVYLRCASLPSQMIQNPRLHLYNPEETAARLYWKQRNLISLFQSHHFTLNIVIIGFGRIGEELLFWGLQNNIFSPDQSIAYHVFGEENGYRLLHPGLNKISDAIQFYSPAWWEQLSLLQQADRIIICQQENQIQTVQKLLSALPGKDLDIWASHVKTFTLCEEQKRLKLFDWKEEALRPEYIFDATTLCRAKAISLRYAQLYSQNSTSTLDIETEWMKLSSFARYSNISSADYHEIRLRMMQSAGLSTDGSNLTNDQLEQLSELEHIRWCRFHFLNNWKYGKPLKGATKDSLLRIHQDLLPYAELSDAEKEKDREAIRVLLSVREY